MSYKKDLELLREFRQALTQCPTYVVKDFLTEALAEFAVRSLQINVDATVRDSLGKLFSNTQK